MRPHLSVALVAPFWPQGSRPNGIVTYVTTLAPALRTLGHEVSIVAASRVDEARPLEGVYYACDVARSSFLERAATRLLHAVVPAAARSEDKSPMVVVARRVAAERAVDVFEIEESFGNAWWIQRGVDVPVCIRLHGPWFLTGPAAGVPDDAVFRRRVEHEGRAIAAASAVSAPSQYVLNRVREQYGISLPEAQVIPNPVAPVPAGERWSLDTCDRRRILFVGRFDRLKGGDLVIEAFRSVLRSVPDACLTFVGPDSGCRIGDRTWQIREFVRRTLPGDLAGRFEWLDARPFSELPALRRSALATVVCSRYETFPYTVMEALAMGCPVIASDVGGISEFVEDGANGLLHRAGDPEDLAERIVEVLSDPVRAALLGRRGMEDCLRLLHPSVVAPQLVALYRRTAGSPAHDSRFASSAKS